MKNFNPIAREIALSDIEILADDEWEHCAVALAANSTGPQAAYGWRHGGAHDPFHPLSITSNYLIRPIYDLSTVKRKFGYGAGGRALDWETKKDEFDNWNGTISLLGEEITGIDTEHFHIGPLVPLAKSFAIVKPLIFGLKNACLGQIVDKDVPTPEQAKLLVINSDRTLANVAKVLIDCLKADVWDHRWNGPIWQWIPACLEDPAWSEYPYARINPKGNKIGGKNTLQLYNGIYWLIPSFFDLYTFAMGANPPWLGKLHTLLINWCKHVETVLKDHDDFGWIDKTANLIQDDEGKYSIAPGDKNKGHALWGFRAFCVARRLGLNARKATLDGLFALYNQEPENKKWLVDWDGSFYDPNHDKWPQGAK